MRSYLYVPGDQPERLEKCLDRGADFVIIDLEDAVSPERKQIGRDTTGAWVAANSEQSAKIWIRVNNTADLSADIHQSLTAEVAGICLPKCDDLETLASVDLILSNVERERGFTPGSLGVQPLIETATGVLNMREIATGPRIRRMLIGEYDLRAELGIVNDESGFELLYVRSQIVIASAAAGILPPIAPVSTDFRDLEKFRASCLEFARMGYLGRTCIHPSQVEVANKAYTPTKEEIEHAQDVISRLAAAGGGIAVDARGKMIDEAVIRIARRVIERAEFIS